MNKIDTNTFIPISFAIILSGFGLYIANLEAKTKSNEYKINDIVKREEIIIRKLDQIADRLSNIEGYLKAQGLKK